MLEIIAKDAKLIKKFASEPDKKGWSSLHYAAANGNEKIVEVLLRKL